MRLEAIVQRLLDKRVAIGEKKHFLRLGALQENVDEPHRGPGFPGAGRHDEQGAALAALKGFGYPADGLVLVGALDDLFVDRRIFERRLVLADKAQAPKIIGRRRIRRSSVDARGRPPRKNDAGRWS